MLRNAALASSVVASMPTVLPVTRLRVGQPLQYPGEDRQVRLDVDPSPRARHRRVVRRRFVQRDVQELSDAQGISGSPRHRPLRVQALEIAEQQHPDVPARRQTRPADSVGVERRALLLDEGIEAGLIEHTIQSLVERVARAPRQVRAGHPHRRLPRAAAAFAHCHGKKCSTSGSVLSIPVREFHHRQLVGSRSSLAGFRSSQAGRMATQFARAPFPAHAGKPPRPYVPNERLRYGSRLSEAAGSPRRGRGEGAQEAHADEPLQRPAANGSPMRTRLLTRLWLPRTVGRRTSPTTRSSASCWR